MSYKVAVVGASGNVGREMLDILHERNFPVSEVVALASSRSAGNEVSFGDKDLVIQDLARRVRRVLLLLIIRAISVWILMFHWLCLKLIRTL